MKILTTLSLMLLINYRSLAQNENYDLFIKEAARFIDTTADRGKNSYHVYFTRFYNTFPDSSFCFAISFFWQNDLKRHISEKYFTYVGSEMILVVDASNDSFVNKYLYEVDSTTYRFTRSRLSSEHLMVCGYPPGVIICSKNGEIKRLDYSGGMPRQITDDDFRYIFTPKPFDMNRLK